MNYDIFNAFPACHTQRLQLDELPNDQLEALAEIAAYKVPNATIEDARALLQKTNQQYKAKEGITWGLYLEGELIGTCGYYRGFENDSGEIGYVMRSAFRQRGLMFEALQQLTEFGFRSMQLKRITAYTSAENIPSVRMLVKAGFTDSGQRHKELTIFESIGNS